MLPWYAGNLVFTTLLDAAAGLDVLDGLEVRLSAKNLLNQTYLASQDTRAVLAPGRSVLLIAVVRFGK